MKINHSNEVWRLLGEPGKYAMQHALLEIEGGNGELIATNGRVVAVVPVELGEGDEPGLVPGDALGDGEPELCWDEIDYRKRELRVAGGTATLAKADGEFPDWRKVIPAPDAPCAVEVSLSAKYLYDLARAMGSDGAIKLRIPAPRDGAVRDAIRVDGPGGCFGAIMPVTFVGTETNP